MDFLRCPLSASWFLGQDRTARSFSGRGNRSHPTGDKIVVPGQLHLIGPVVNLGYFIDDKPPVVPTRERRQPDKRLLGHQQDIPKGLRLTEEFDELADDPLDPEQDRRGR